MTIERKLETYNPDHREDLFNDKVMTNHVNSMSKVLLDDMELRGRFNGRFSDGNFNKKCQNGTF